MFIYQANPSQCLQFHRAARSLWAWTTGRPVPVRPHKRSPEAARIALIIIDPHDLGVCFIDTSVLTKGFRASVDSIRDWPLGHGQSKVPSRIAYTEPNEGGTPRRRAWGFEVLPGMSSCSWIKLLLDADARLTEFDDDALNHAAALGIFYIPAGKAIVDVVADYLCRIYQYTWKALISILGKILKPFLWNFGSQSRQLGPSRPRSRPKKRQLGQDLDRGRTTAFSPRQSPKRLHRLSLKHTQRVFRYV